MKTLKLVAFAIIFFLAGSAQGQVSLRVNIGVAPQWGPAGYSDAQYYYLPDVEAYYDINTSEFIYNEGRSWVRRSYLPNRYRNYDLYNGYKVVMNDYHGRTPYYIHHDYRTRYARGYRGDYQRNIGERSGRGNYDQWYSRENNQANRGRGGYIDRNYSRGDDSYDRRGIQNRRSDHWNSQGDRRDNGNYRGNDHRVGNGNRRNDNHDRNDNRRDDDHGNDNYARNGKTK
jgi:hypothetical protein